MTRKCKLLIHDSKIKENIWVDGEIIREVAGDAGENFNRYEVRTAQHAYSPCHPDCVREEAQHA